MTIDTHVDTLCNNMLLLFFLFVLFSSKVYEYPVLVKWTLDLQMYDNDIQCSVEKKDPK